MKRVVLCFDGTWNKPGQGEEEDRVESNVRRFFSSVRPAGADGVRQLTWYNEGVGTSWFNKFGGGLLGAGLDFHIIQGYRKLAELYEAGDEVYVLGFSRGAYTARSLVGLVRNCGLVSPGFADIGAGIAYGIYRTRGDGPDSFTAKAFRAANSRPVKFKFLGVWDTVGALGIPLDFAEDLNMAMHQFHDTELSAIVENARHALAIDEHRLDYDATLWGPKTKPGQSVEQRWFVGAHSDVGGGYPDRRLSDITLAWMQAEAAALGLAVSPVAPGEENYRSDPVDSYRHFLGGLYAKKHPQHFRQVHRTPFGNEVIDPTVDRRRRLAGLNYRPVNPGLPTLVA